MPRISNNEQSWVEETRELIKERLHNGTISQRQIAKECGIDQGHFSCFLKGKKNIASQKLLVVLTSLGIQVSPYQKEQIPNSVDSLSSLSLNDLHALMRLFERHRLNSAHLKFLLSNDRAALNVCRTIRDLYELLN